MPNKLLVFIIGCSGFIGTHLIKNLVYKDVEIIGVDKIIRNDYGSKNIKIIKLDISNQEGISILKNELGKISDREVCLVHLAGISDAGICERDKVLAYQVNVKATQDIWRISSDCKIKKLIFSSTGLVYGTQYKDLITEEHPVFPENTYARTKLEAENYLLNKSAASGVSCVVLRLANVYGPGMSRDTVIKTILDQLNSGELKLREYKSVRDYVFIDDVVEAFTLNILSDTKFSVYNVGSSVGYSVYALAKTIAKIISKEGILAAAKLRKKDFEAGSKLVLSSIRIGEDLAWKPNFNVETGIKRMLDQEHS